MKTPSPTPPTLVSWPQLLVPGSVTQAIRHDCLEPCCFKPVDCPAPLCARAKAHSLAPEPVMPSPAHSSCLVCPAAAAQVPDPSISCSSPHCSCGSFEPGRGSAQRLQLQGVDTTMCLFLFLFSVFCFGGGVLVLVCCTLRHPCIKMRRALPVGRTGQLGTCGSMSQARHVRGMFWGRRVLKQGAFIKMSLFVSPAEHFSQKGFSSGGFRVPAGSPAGDHLTLCLLFGVETGPGSTNVSLAAL